MERFTESTVEEAALSWFKELRYTVAHAPHLAPAEIAAQHAHTACAPW